MQNTYQQKIDALHALTEEESFLNHHVVELLEQWIAMEASEYHPDPAELIELLQKTAKVEMLFAAGQQQNEELWAQVSDTYFADWSELEDLPVEKKLQDGLAKALVKAVELESGDNLYVGTGTDGRQVVETLAQHCLDNDIDLTINFDDQVFSTLLLDACTEEQVDQLGEWIAERDTHVTKTVGISSSPPAEALEGLPSVGQKKQQWAAYGEELRNRRMNDSREDHVPWSVTILPSQEDARVDGIEYEDYLRLYFEACDMPPHVAAAQQPVVDAFTRATKAHITNSDGTDLTLDITDRPFLNGGPADKNIPAAEFFSSPVRDGVNGTLVSHGIFRSPSGDVLEDITLVFENGRVVDFDARVGKEHMEKALSLTDDLDPEDEKFEGSRHLGEFAFGTNPHFNRHVSNRLLVEKIAGSFHVALGQAYGTITDAYTGEPIALDNGNKAPIHWDISTMLKGKDGEVTLEIDGKDYLVQKDGDWQAIPELGISEEDVDILNRGWRALQEQGQVIPASWKAKFAEEDRAAGVGPDRDVA